MLLKGVLFVTHYVIYLRSLLWGWLMAYSKPLALFFHKQTFLQINSDAKSLKKLPIHLGIIVTEDEISFTDVANMILWCMAMGISYISIYDRHGVCKRQKKAIEEKLNNQRDVILGKESKKYSPSLRIGLHQQQQEEETGCGSERSEVLLLDRSDGRPSLVTAARHLAREVSSKHTSLADITPTAVDNLLKGHSQGYPDPDLIFRFGSSPCLMGYLPWQIRLTEILSLPSHHKLDYATFHKALMSYSSTEQRFGK